MTHDYPQIEEAFKKEIQSLSGLPDDPEIEITATYNVPSDYIIRHGQVLEDIIDKSKDQTRSKCTSFYLIELRFSPQKFLKTLLLLTLS